MVITDAPAGAEPPDELVEPTAVHRAIDCLAAIGIEIQLLRRKIHRGEDIQTTELDEAMARVEPQLDALSAILVGLRDQSSQ